MTSFPVYSIFGLAYASAFTSFHVCTWSSWGILCENTLFKSLQICSTHATPGIDGDTMHVDSLVEFWMGGVDQRIFGPSTAAPLEKPKRQHPREVQWLSGSMTINGVHNKTIKNNCKTWSNVSRQFHCDLLKQNNNIIPLNIAYKQGTRPRNNMAFFLFVCDY